MARKKQKPPGEYPSDIKESLIVLYDFRNSEYQKDIENLEDNEINEKWDKIDKALNILLNSNK